MDSAETDWGDWTLNNTGQLDAGMDDAGADGEDDDEEEEEDDDDTKPDLVSFMDDDEASRDVASLCGDGGVDDAGRLDDYSSGGESDSEGEEGQEGGAAPTPPGHRLSAPHGVYLKRTVKKEGMATCEYCGRLGVQDAFYSKTKQFCSLACARTSQKQGKLSALHVGGVGVIKKEKGDKTKLQVAARNKQGGGTSFDWSEYLNKTGSEAATVARFKHCPMADCWDCIAVGMKVEVRNTDCGLATTVYWIATVIRLTGYRVLLRYEGFSGDALLDFWTNLCVPGVYPVGWCAANGKPLVPPVTIQQKYTDWKQFLVKRLTGARTLPQGFGKRVQAGVRHAPLSRGTTLEVVDKTCVSAMRVAVVRETICGRLKLVYVDNKHENDEFWCHSHSPLVHPVGWSQLVGHKLHSTPEYKTESLNKAAFRRYLPTDASPDMFQKVKELAAGGLKFQAGTKLEAIDPLNLCTICVATVMKVLRNNYLMIGIDGSMAADGSDWFCYHSMSPYIFPVGFCDINNLQLTPPRGYKGLFKWSDYLRQTKSVAAPVTLFDKEIPKHCFRVGMLLEAVDLMEPRLICVGTVTDVVGRLLRVHFNGWHSTYDQWVDCQSPDIYPVGWCEMVGYHLEGPLSAAVENAGLPMSLKKKRTKSQIYRGPRKKRKSKVTGMPASRLAKLSAGVAPRVVRGSPSASADRGVPYGGELSALQDPLAPLLTPVPPPPTDAGLPSMPHLTGVNPAPGGAAPTPDSATPPPLAQSLPSIVSMLNSPPRCAPTPGLESAPPTPNAWDALDVCQFLRSNDCGAHCDSFRKRNIDGPRLLQLSKEQIVGLTGMKVGPSLKIHDLIQALKTRVANSPTAAQVATPLATASPRLATTSC